MITLILIINWLADISERKMIKYYKEIWEEE